MTCLYSSLVEELAFVNRLIIIKGRKSSKKQENIMRDQIVSTANHIVNAFSWLIEIFIGWTSPGLLFLSALFFAFPAFKEYTGSTFDFWGLGVIVYGILWPTVVGIFLIFILVFKI